MSRKKTRVLELDLDQPVVEAEPATFPLRSFGEKEILFFDVMTALRRARKDPNVVGLSLKIRPTEIGWAMLGELRDELDRFRASGKRTIAHLESGGNREWALASGCETLLLHPGALLTVSSPGLEAMFLKDALIDIGIEPDFEAVGEYKAAGEQASLREMSDANREQLEALVRGLRQELVKMVASGRGVSDEIVSRWLDAGPYSARQALEAGLVNELCEDLDIEERFEDADGGIPRSVSFRLFARRPGLVRRLFRRRRPQIALLQASGFITERRRNSLARSVIGAKELVAQLDRARDAKRVKAIVLRIDSSGGDAMASERIRESMQRAREEKPIIVSMGDTAASGGYLIATAASKIFAAPATLTGSIGVLGGKVVIRRLLDRLGVHRDSVNSGDNAGMFSSLRRFRSHEKKWYRTWMEEFYRNRFLPAVIESREMDFESADAVARGRIWLGRDAKTRRLVDELGGVHDAIEAACEAAGLERERTNVVRFVKRRGLLSLFRGGVSAGTSIPESLRSMHLAKLDEWEEMLEWLSSLRPNVLLAVMPFRIRIR